MTAALVRAQHGNSKSKVNTKEATINQWLATLAMTMLTESHNSSGIIDTAVQGAAKVDDSKRASSSTGKMTASATVKEDNNNSSKLKSNNQPAARTVATTSSNSTGLDSITGIAASSNGVTTQQEQ